MFLVTGGNGFVGNALVNELALRGLSVRSASRSIQTIIQRDVLAQRENVPFLAT